MQPAHLIGVAINSYTQNMAHGFFYSLGSPKIYFNAENNEPLSLINWQVFLLSSCDEKLKPAISRLINCTLVGQNIRGPITILDVHVVGFLELEHLIIGPNTELLELKSTIINPHNWQEVDSHNNPWGTINFKNGKFEINLPSTEKKPESYIAAIRRATKSGYAPLLPMIDWGYTYFDFLKPIINPSDEDEKPKDPEDGGCF
jgi:hypothetical protein